MTHRYELIRDNTKAFDDLKPNINKLGEILNDIKDKLGSNLSKFISREEYNTIKKLDPKELGIRGVNSIEQKLYTILDKLINRASSDLTLLKSSGDIPQKLLSQYQIIKDKTVQFKRDEAQKDLKNIAKSAMSNKYTDLRRNILNLYDMTHRYDLIKDNTKGFKEIQAKLKILRKILKDIKNRLGTNLSSYMTREEYNNIKKLDPKELGLLGNSKIESKLYGIVDKLLDKAKGELFLLKMSKLYPEEE
jgi:biopolymer transport protein ExbB/TolQ